MALNSSGWKKLSDLQIALIRPWNLWPLKNIFQRLITQMWGMKLERCSVLFDLVDHKFHCSRKQSFSSQNSHKLSFFNSQFHCFFIKDFYVCLLRSRDKTIRISIFPLMVLPCNAAFFFLNSHIKISISMKI